MYREPVGNYWKLSGNCRNPSKPPGPSPSPSRLYTIHITKCKLTNVYIAFCFEVLGSDMSTYTSDFTTLVLVINALLLRVGASYRVFDGDCSMSTLIFTVVLICFKLKHFLRNFFLYIIVCFKA